MSKILLEMGCDGGGITIIKIDNSTYALRKQEMSYEFADEPATEAIDKTTPLSSLEKVIELLEANKNWLYLYPLVADKEIRPMLRELIIKIGDEGLIKNWRRLFVNDDDFSCGSLF